MKISQQFYVKLRQIDTLYFIHSFIYLFTIRRYKIKAEIRIASNSTAITLHKNAANVTLQHDLLAEYIMIILYVGYTEWAKVYIQSNSSLSK